MNVNEMLKHVDHTLLTQTATWEEIKNCDSETQKRLLAYFQMLSKQKES